MQGLGVDGHWIGVRDGDPRAVDIFRRHYSANLNVPRVTHLRYGFSGPGQTMTLMTVEADALWTWVNQIRDDGQDGVNCSVFRNEGKVLSSELIIEACRLAWHRWPGYRLFTYVWDAKVQSVNPGYCYKMAGWRTCGRNPDGRMTILEVRPW